MYKHSEDLAKFENRVWLSSPTMHGDELKYMTEAYETNWMSTVGKNIDCVEESICDYIGCKYSVGLSSGTAALHLAIKLAGERLYGKTINGRGSLCGHKVFCSDLTFAATLNPVVYEGGEPVFIDTEYDSWNMDPESLRKAFEQFPEVKLIVVVHLYGTPAKMNEIRAIADEHGALIVEDAAESLGSSYSGIQTGLFGDYAAISFNGNKIITGSSGGAFLTNNESDAIKVRKWSTQSRENASWYQHEDLGYNYRMSNVVAGVIRGQMAYLDEHISQKTSVFERYSEGFKDLPVTMNPVPSNCVANHWLSCMLIDKDAMCKQERTSTEATYVEEDGKSCPTEILKTLMTINAEGRPIWKPMHMQPIFAENSFVSANSVDVSADIFERGLCLPSDNKMTPEQQNRIIEIVRRYFE